MAANPVLAIIAVARLLEINWCALDDQEWFSYNYLEGKNMARSAEPPMVCRSARGTEVREEGCAEVKPKYRSKFAHCRMSMERAWLALHRYLADGTDFKYIFILVEQNALTNSASPSVSVSGAENVVPEV